MDFKRIAGAGVIGLAGLVGNGCMSLIEGEIRQVQKEQDVRAAWHRIENERILFFANGFHGDLNANGLDFQDFDGIKSVFTQNEPVYLFLMAGGYKGQKIKFDISCDNGDRETIERINPNPPVWVRPCVEVGWNPNTLKNGSYDVRAYAPNGSLITQGRFTIIGNNYGD